MGWVSRAARAQKSPHITPYPGNAQVQSACDGCTIVAVHPGITHMINQECCMPRNFMGCMHESNFIWLS